jgi:acyl-coenzyme A thioesterase PaaI-like protein
MDEVPTSLKRDVELPAAHWVGSMGLTTTVEDGFTRGWAPVTPMLFGATDERIRVGVLATLIDVVGGTPPTGPLNPTIDLRVQMVGRPPTSGRLNLECRPLRMGRTLYVAEIPVFADGAAEPFAVGTVTFMNKAIGVPGFDGPRFDGSERVGGPAGGLDELLGARRGDDGVAELAFNPVVGNGFTGTIQGGAQAMFAELATEWALADLGHPAGTQPVDDLDIRYLNRLASGTMRAEPELWPTEDGGYAARVALTDAAEPERVVSFVRLRTRPAA